MIRIMIAGVVGAVVYFVWGMLAWMAVPLHTPTIHALPAESAIIDALKTQHLETGVYVAPYSENPADMSEPESEFMKRHTAGPIFSVYYQREGAEPMNAGVLGTGFVIDLLAALLAACLLSSIGPCGRSYWCRVGFVTGLGIFVAVVGHLSYWNWMHFPLGYTVAFMIDVTVGWLLAGLAIAALIRPPTKEPKSVVAVAPAVDTKPEKRVTPAAPPQPTAPVRNDAISLLATLQREARFVDIVKEPLADYSDAQVAQQYATCCETAGLFSIGFSKSSPSSSRKKCNGRDSPGCRFSNVSDLRKGNRKGNLRIACASRLASQTMRAAKVERFERVGHDRCARGTGS